MSKKITQKETMDIIYLLIIGYPLSLLISFFENYGNALGAGILLFLICICVIFVSVLIFEYFYYKSQKFLEIKKSIETNTCQCNELNAHIEELKQISLIDRAIDYGKADYRDVSKYGYQRKNLEKLSQNSNVYDCSLSVCKGAQEQPFKYLCKYFDIKADETSLSNIEKMFNDFSAAEQGKFLLKKEREKILDSIQNKLPYILLKFRPKKLIKKLGFNEIDFSDCYFPKYTFNYVSPGGNSAISCDIQLDIENLEKFISYLSGIIKFKKSIAGQRSLMTSALREKIKKRDEYKCRNCGASIEQEPNLLLEIDHILPLAKGGITTEDNLQTLCWRCNRKKGSKILNNDN